MGFHRSRIFLFLLLAFFAGVAIGSFFEATTAVVLVLFGVAALLFAASAYRGLARYPVLARYRHIGYVIACLLVVAALGIARTNAFRADHGILSAFTDRLVKGRGQPVTMQGFVAGDTTISVKEAQFPFHVREVIFPDRVLPADETILVRTDSSSPHRYGDRLRLKGPLGYPRNFGQFDYVAYLKKDGIELIAERPEILAYQEYLPFSQLEGWRIGLYRELFMLRDKFLNALSRSLPEPEASYVAGILVGVKAQIPSEIIGQFQRTGTSHILAISGYNITVIADVVMAGLAYGVRRRRAFWLAAAGIACFTIMTGASASVVRAAIMGLILLCASAYGRVSDVLTAVVCAAAAMVFFNPMLLRFDVGFQLSFLAVLGLIWCQPIVERLTIRIPMAAWLREVLTATVSAQIMTLPLTLYYFRTVSLVALPANALVLSLMPLTMLAGFVAGAAGMAWVAAGQVIGLGALVLTAYQLAVVRLLASLPFASVAAHVSSATALALYVLIGYGIWRLRRI